MVDYPQVMSVKKLQDIISMIPNIGVPSQVDNRFLQENGYTSSHDTKLISPLKFVGLVEKKARGGAPTPRWRSARANLGTALAEGLREGYAELFSKYPNAHQRDVESLTNYFRANTEHAADSARRMAETFLAMCELADLSATPEVDSEDAIRPENNHGVAPGKPPQPGMEKPASGSGVSVMVGNYPNVTINIELQVPSDPTGEVYEKFFKAMREHLIESLRK